MIKKLGEFELIEKNLKESSDTLNRELSKYKSELNELKAKLEETNAQKESAEKNYSLNQKNFQNTLYCMFLI